MKYYKAKEIGTIPFIIWNEVAANIKELEALNLDNDPLVRRFDLIPANLYGVCPLKIDNGQLVDRSIEEMANYENQYQIKTALQRAQSKINVLRVESFRFGDYDFPLDDASRELYNAIAVVKGEIAVMSIIGEKIDITAGQIDDFVLAFNNKTMQILNNYE
jgi:hypothetical protein